MRKQISFCSVLFTVLLLWFSINLQAQTPQGIGKFKILEYSLETLLSEYEFSDLKDSDENFITTFPIRRFGGVKNYEIIPDGGFAYSSKLEEQRIFNICNYSVAGLELKGLHLYFYKGVLYKITIENNIKELLDKLMIKYPSVEKDETNTEDVFFQNAFGATIKKTNVSREGRWNDDAGMSVSFVDNLYYDDDGDLQHRELIRISNIKISDEISNINRNKSLKNQEIEEQRQKEEKQKQEEEIMNSDL